MSITIERAAPADAAAFLAGMEASCDDLMLLAKEEGDIILFSK